MRNERHRPIGFVAFLDGPANGLSSRNHETGNNQNLRSMLTLVNISGTKEVGVMAIPPGPQIPFSKDRKYGQEPGFVSRHSSKIYLILGIAAVALIVWFFVVLLPSTTD